MYYHTGQIYAFLSCLMLKIFIHLSLIMSYLFIPSSENIGPPIELWHSVKIETVCLMPVSRACNPSYLGDWDREDQRLRPALANSSWDPISKIITAKWVGGVAQAVECLLCRHEALSLNPTLITKKKGGNKRRLFIASSLSQLWLRSLGDHEVGLTILVTHWEACGFTLGFGHCGLVPWTLHRNRWRNWRREGGQTKSRYCSLIRSLVVSHRSRKVDAEICGLKRK
jgi:hypothetical protein